MSKEKKAKYDIEGIATEFRNAMYGMALFMISGYLISEILEIDSIKTYVFYISLAIGIPYLLIRSNSKKYMINKDL